MSCIKVFPCLSCWTPEVKCSKYVFIDKSTCVDCQKLQRRVGGSQLAAADVHAALVQYLLDKHSQSGGITQQRIDEYIYSAKQVKVDNLLSVALEHISRNYRGVYGAVLDAVEAAENRETRQWTPVNLEERLERIRKEQERRRQGDDPDKKA
ncbi:hypothetical protein FZEAL_8823 [Fusarium zealandicum]|uniref:Uncharacterized protein n=1 Tax=Fusarium zealandicum TaxID=1053134 RepID=A0A8H4UD53_9HYPO|nr:hypothetical protein FZEAL_8823 [Fusarium zealandicum]